MLRSECPQPALGATEVESGGHCANKASVGPLDWYRDDQNPFGQGLIPRGVADQGIVGAQLPGPVPRKPQRTKLVGTGAGYPTLWIEHQ